MVHHGPVTNRVSRWSTTAEQVDGKLYIYYDFPNDQDPHLYIDDNLFDGVPGTNMGLAFKDPSDGSDCTIIRELDGNFHLIYDWSPINARANHWDSPLAGHAVSPDGIGNFTILAPAVDETTTPTGEFSDYSHPHWHSEDPVNFPVKPGEKTAFATYEIHSPEQNAFGDWAVICVGGQYYLFGDYDEAGGALLRLGWFTSASLDKQFKLVGEMGNGHPDPDIMFADGQFYLVTQVGDYVSPGPWVGEVEVRVEVRVGVNVGPARNGRRRVLWGRWQKVEETYDYVPGFSKQVGMSPARIDISDLLEGNEFRIDVRYDSSNSTANPVFRKITLGYD